MSIIIAVLLFLVFSSSSWWVIIEAAADVITEDILGTNLGAHPATQHGEILYLIHIRR